VRGHVDPETLAAFREELLPRRKAGQVAAHLAGCPQCAGLDAQLAGLPALLAHAPAPPMPDALTARIEAALAAEAAARSARAPAGVPATEAATGADAPLAGPGSAGPRGGRSGRWRRPVAPGRSRLALRIAVAAAAVVVVAGGGYGVSRLLSGAAPLATGSAPSAGGNGAAAPRAPGGVSAGAEHAAAGNSGSKDKMPMPGPGGYPVVASGTDYRASLLKTQVKATLNRVRGAAPTASAAAASRSPAFRLASSCLAGVTGGQRPRLVDVARYEGRPATVVVVPAGTRALQALVFAGHCPAARVDLLTSTTLPGPG
jgi:hypothetical protein